MEVTHTYEFNSSKCTYRFGAIQRHRQGGYNHVLQVKSGPFWRTIEEIHATHSLDFKNLWLKEWCKVFGIKDTSKINLP